MNLDCILNVMEALEHFNEQSHNLFHVSQKSLWLLWGEWNIEEQKPRQDNGLEVVAITQTRD